MITLQFTYLHSWWRHNCVILHATKVYFIELLLNIKYIEFWLQFEDKILIKKICENVKVFLPEDWQKICTKKIKKRWTLGGFLRKLQTAGSIERTPGSGRLYCRLKMLCSVKTQLGWCYKFCSFFVKHSFLFPLVQKSIKIDQETPEL